MRKVKEIGFRFAEDESGATAIEYCLIATGIALAIIFTVSDLGDEIAALFTEVKGGF